MQRLLFALWALALAYTTWVAVHHGLPEPSSAPTFTDAKLLQQGHSEPPRVYRRIHPLRESIHEKETTRLLDRSQRARCTPSTRV